MIDQLLARIAEVDDEEDIVVQYNSATWVDKSLQLQIAISMSDLPEEHWGIRCENVLASALHHHNASWIELTDDHPLLWEFKSENVSAFFYKTPVDANAAVGALYEAHQKAVGSWIKFDQYLNAPISLSKLLAAGNGLLARGPLPLITLYKHTLRLHGVEVDVRFANPPKIWDGSHWQQLEPKNTIKALLLGTSYVIGDGWTAQQNG